jgi:hypothetical protein
MVSEPTLTVSPTRAGQGRGHGARARGGIVRGHLGCAVGTGCTDVVHVPLALDARTWPREDISGLGLTNEDVGLLRE